MHQKALTKIVFFHPRFSNGGVERTNIGLAKILIKAGYEVSFATFLHTNHFLKEVKQSGIEFISLPATKASTAQLYLLTYIKEEAKKFSRVVVISCQNYANITCCLFKPFWPKNCDLVLSERNHLDELDHNKNFKSNLIKRLMPLTYAQADKIVANSSELAESLSSRLQTSVSVIYNPTIQNRIFELAQEEITESWFPKDSVSTIVAIGRLSTQKDFDTLIKAFSILRRSIEAKLLILGDGEKRNDLTKLINELNIQSDVLMPGFVSNPYKFLKNSEIFVLSSIYEGLPNVLIEALALGVPSVSTLCRSGPKEILLDGDAGILVPMQNPELLANAIIDMIQNPEVARKMIETAKQSLERFKPDSVARELIRVLNLPNIDEYGAI